MRNILTAVLLAATLISGADLYSVSGTISGHKKGHSLYLAMYTDQKGFDTQTPFLKKRFIATKVTEAPITYTFADVPPGEYIVTAYQDLDDNGRLNMAGFIPAEPYRIYKPHTGMFKPNFNKMKFRVAANVTSADLQF